MTLFGWTPDPSRLTTLAGCAGVKAELRQVCATVQRVMESRSEGESAPYIKELVRLAELRREIETLYDNLDVQFDRNRDQFNKAVRRIVRERFGEAEFQSIVDEANRRVEAQNAQPSTVANGRALEPRSTGGGMRQRK